MLTRLFLAVWRMSVYGAATALVVGAAVLLLRRLRVGRAVCCVLWLVVLARLLCPVSIPSAVSIFNTPVLGRCVGAAKGAEAGADVLWTIEPGADLIGGVDLTDAAAGAAGADAPAQAARPGQAGADAAQQGSPRQPEISAAGGGAAQSDAAEAGQPGAGFTLLAVIWLAGAVGMGLRALWQVARLRGQVSLAYRLAGEPDVFASERVAEPFSFGLVRPRIYLPASLAGEERRVILLHERAHLRRRDNLVKPLFYAAVCLHWFNPLAWLAFRGMSCDMEAACDEAVLRAAGSGVKTAYCESLLRFAAPQTAPRRAAVALHFGEGRVAGRVRAILRYRRPAVWAGLAAGLAAALLAAACMADPAGAADGPDTGSGAAQSAPADSVSANSAPADSTPANSAPAQHEFAESVPAELPAQSGAAGGIPAEGDAAASVPAMAGEDLPLIYSEDGSLLWPVPEYTGWHECLGAVAYGSRLFAPEGSVLLAMADGTVETLELTGSTGCNITLRCAEESERGSFVLCRGDLTPLVREGDTVCRGQVIATLTPSDEPGGPACAVTVWIDGTAICFSSLFAELAGPEPVTDEDMPAMLTKAPYEPGRLTWPVPEYKYVSRWMSSYHKGTDICANRGASVVATADGTVMNAGWHYSYGNYVVLDHGNGWRSLYAHCEELLVSRGETVARGEEIAKVGSTGNTTGVQCHFELYCYGTRVSARDYFDGK